jgi:hypothetical protein
METKEYRRDPNSKALINRNKESLVAYRKRRADARKLESMEASINTLQTNVNTILGLLKQMLTPQPV